LLNSICIPGLRGVLADLPHVLERARQCVFMAGALQNHSNYNPAIFSKQYLLAAAPI
jgi:hypothetical protein